MIVAGGIAVLTVTSLGLVFAAAAPAPVAEITQAAPTTQADATGASTDARPRLGLAVDRLQRRAGWWLRVARHLVHAEATVTGPDGELIVLGFDHGSVTSIAGGTLTLAEEGKTTRSVSVDDATIVYVGREDGTVDDVTAGAEVFVQSRVDGGTALAKRILVVPSKTAT
jgi:hypothetical protein